MKYEILEIGEHKMPIRFGFNALRKYSLMTGSTMNDLNKLSSGAAKQPFTYNIDEVTDMFDGNMDCMEKAFEILGRAMGDGNEKKVKAKKVKKKS